MAVCTVVRLVRCDEASVVLSKGMVFEDIAVGVLSAS